MSDYILVVDDEPDVREILELVLGTLQLPVQDVHNGYDALIAIQEDLPLVMLLDLQMPEYDGQYVLDQLKRRNIMLPIIIFTSHDITADLADKLDISEERMFQKGSVSMTKLRHQVIEIVGEKLQIDISLL